MCIDNMTKKVDTLTLTITTGTIQVRGTVLQYSYFSFLS